MVLNRVFGWGFDSAEPFFFFDVVLFLISKVRIIFKGNLLAPPDIFILHALRVNVKSLFQDISQIFLLFTH